MNTFLVMIELISKDAKFCRKCFVAQSRRVHDAWPYVTRAGGWGPLVFQVGYHPRKRTFKTHPKHVFFRYENVTLNTHFCMRVSVICPVMSFPKFVI